MRFSQQKFFWVVGLVFHLVVLQTARGEWRLTQLRCEQRINPLGVGTASPRLSWQLQSSRNGEEQAGFQAQAATSAALLRAGKPDLWDTGRVADSETLNLTYGGKAPGSGKRVFWRVRSWNGADEVTPYSEPAWFETGLLRGSDWRAAWISRPAREIKMEAEMFGDQPAPLFRKEFVLAKKVRSARLYVSGLGYYEARLNARQVGDHALDPGWTAYDKRVLYSTYDVTGQLRTGRNTLGVMLGNGWFNPLPLRFWGRINLREHLTIGEPRFIAQLEVTFQDGTSTVIATDKTWRWSDGPILRNSLYLGEVYDAQREPPGWDNPGFNDSHWRPVVPVEGGLGPLRAQEAPPIRVTRSLAARRVTEPKPGVFLFDLGQNFAGWARLEVRGPAGTRVRLRYGELLNQDGTLNGMTSVAGQIKQGGASYVYPGAGAPRTAWQQDEYILRGVGREIYTPRFTFHGFRYVEVTGYPGKPGKHAISGLRLNSEVAPVGHFESSDPLLNRIQEMVLWTELSNLFSVQSDCPHREKFGYGGDIVASSEMAMLNFDMARFYAKAAQDLTDDARTNGGFTETAPFVGVSDEGLGENSGPIGWGTAQPLLLWQLFQYYGDRRIIAENYEAAARWIALLRTSAKDGILDNGLSDHESLAPKPRALTGTAFYYYNLQLFARLSKILEKTAEMLEVEKASEEVKTAFNRSFLKPGTGRYGEATQASQAFALHLGLTPLEEQPKALEVLLADLQANKGRLTTGIFGTKYMLNVLTDMGRADAAWRMVATREFPGWGYMLEGGATTLWEHWAFSDNTYSHNHPMFGSVSEWFYKALAGITPAIEAEGFDKIVLRPQPVGDLKWVKASYDSVRGPIASAWARAGDKFKWNLQIPVGCRATVFLPHNGRETEKLINRCERQRGVKFARRDTGCLVFTVGAGKYLFESELP